MKSFWLISLFVAALLPTNKIIAQTDVQNTGTLYISGPTDTLYITGNFTNASGAAMTNNGNLSIKLGLSNAQAAMPAGTGTLYLNGSSAQTVSGTQVFNTFNFVSNNSAGITLNNDLDISGAHTFLSGIITSSATPNYLIYEAGASCTGDGDAQHVNGPVRKTGTTNFSFPVGNSTVERPIAITNLSLSSTFNANYAGVTNNTSNVTPPLAAVDPYEYWVLNRVSGGSAQVAMNWDKSKINFPDYILADIRVANYIAGNWTSIGGNASGNPLTTGTINSNSTSSFGSFTFGSLSFALPVTLLSFTAQQATGYNLIAWTTTNEINVGSYEVQRSDDSRTFYIAGTVAARNLFAEQHYALADSKPMNDAVYYRLRSVDIDGKSQLSDIIKLNARISTHNYFAIASPAYGMLTVTAANVQSGRYDYHIMTIGGQTVQRGDLIIGNNGSYQLALSSSIVRGIYVVEFRKDGFVYSQRVLVQ